MTAARDAILGKISRALTKIPFPEIPDLPENATLGRDITDRETLLTEFQSRWDALGGELTLIRTSEDLDRALEDLLGKYKGQPLALAKSAEMAAPGLEARLRGMGHEFCPCHPQSSADAAAGLTGAELLLAYSGTILVTSENTGELAASLVPPVHVALATMDKLVYGIEHVLNKLTAGGPPRGAALISGPSRTADIELTLVQGVHGPGETHLLVMDGPLSLENHQSG